MYFFLRKQYTASPEFNHLSNLSDLIHSLHLRHVNNLSPSTHLMDVSNLNDLRDSKDLSHLNYFSNLIKGVTSAMVSTQISVMTKLIQLQLKNFELIQI